jgi:flagellar motor protein MotB
MRLDSEGFGEARPVCTEKDLACRKRNRRTEFILVELNGKPVKRKEIPIKESP